MSHSSVNSRQLALEILHQIDQQKTYTDQALDRGLKSSSLSSQDRGLVTELIYGIIRRQRSLDTLIDQFGKKTSQQQPPKLRRILHLGLYQLRYLDHIPVSAAVNTSVELAKNNGFKNLSGVVNGILRQYSRLSDHHQIDPLILPNDLTQRLGILYSFPDWLIDLWLNEFGETETEALCIWFNQTPTIDLRINSLKSSLNEVKEAFKAENMAYLELQNFPQTLRLTGNQRHIQKLPYFGEGAWTVQESSAQLVSYLLDPQPNEVIIDACAAPGGKTTHIAELMQDKGTIWACDAIPSRLKKIQQNLDRLLLKSIKLQVGDSRHCPQFKAIGDRVLLDVPCSGLGTLHRHPDIRWRQTPENIQKLTLLQKELLTEASTWVKPQGVLVYATCTLNRAENEDIILEFMKNNPNWQIELPSHHFPLSDHFHPSGWLKILPHQHQMDGFFMVKMRKTVSFIKDSEKPS